jgi:branched-chain amino acid transport system substrate-binding protein
MNKRVFPVKFKTGALAPSVKAITNLLILFMVVTAVTVATAAAENQDLPAGVAMGVILPLSGAQASLGHMQKNSMALAVQEVNRRGGISGETLKLDFRDCGSQVSDINPVIDHFVKDKAYPVILGGGSSKLITAMAERAQYRKVPLVTVTGSKDDISSRGYGYVYRVAPVRSSYPSAAFEFASAEMEVRKVALWYETSAYGTSMARAVRSAASERDWELSWEGSLDPGTLNLEAQLEEIGNSSPDLIFICAFPPDDTRIVTRLYEKVGSEVAIVNLVPSSSLAGSLASCADKCADLFSPSLWLPSSDPAAQRFFDNYVERFGSAPDYHGAQAYAAVRVAAAALQRAGALTPEAVREALGSVGVSTPYGYVTFRNSGQFTNQNSPPSYLLKWTGEGFEQVWPEEQ